MTGFVERYYGFGAAGVKLAAAPYLRHPRELPWRDAIREFAAVGVSSQRSRPVGMAAFVASVLVLLTWLAPPADRFGVSDIEIALFEEVRPLPEPTPAESVPAPRARPDPPPPAPLELEPEVIPKPIPAAAKPRPALPEPPSRISPASPRSAEPPRARPAPVQPTPAARVRPRIDPLTAPVVPNAEAPAFEVARVSRGLPARGPDRSVAAIAAVAAPEPAGSSGMERVRSTRRSAPSTPRRSPSARRPGAVVRIEPAPSMASARTPDRRTHAVRPAPPASIAQRTSPKPRAGEGLAGVPLGSLASCVSDREEDRLKRRVIAALRGPAQCASSAGRFRFVETKNLNAFLMWTERSARRREADRCGELELALACLRGGTLTEARIR